MPLLPLLINDVYISYDVLYNILQSHIKEQGYAMSIKWSKKNPWDKNKLIKVCFVCDYGKSIHKSRAHIQKNILLKCLDCSFFCYSLYSVACKGWIIKNKCEDHNHSLFNNSAAHAVHCLIELNNTLFDNLEQSFKANIHPQQFLTKQWLENSETLLRSVNIYNTKLMIYCKNLDQLTSIQALMQ